MPPKRGRANKEVEEKDTNGQAEPEPRKGRTRGEKTKEETVEDEIEVQPKKRPGKKDTKKDEENGGSEEKKTKKGKKKEEEAEDNSENVDKKVKRGKKEDEPAEEVEEKQTKTRGRKKKEEVNEEVEKVPKKGKKNDEEPKEEEKKPVRGRKKKTEDEEAEVVDKVKKGKKKVEDEDVEMEEVNEDDNKPKAKAGKKKAEEEDAPKARGTRANKKKNGNADEEEPAVKKAKTPANKTDTNLDDINFDCDKENAEGKKSNIKICSWNVSGIRALLKKNGFEYIIKENADIVALQETKCDLAKLPEEINIPGYKHKFVESTGQSGYSGIAVYSKESFVSVTEGINDPDLDKEGRMLTIEYPNFYFVNVYVPNAGDKLKTMDKRMKFNKLFQEWVKELDSKKPVIICGDLNVAHKEIDLKNPKTNTKHAGFTPEERQGMTDLLDAGFVDVFRHFYPDKTDAYTFWSNMGKAREKNVGWRLDYYLVSDRIKNKVCDTVIRDEVFGSDHCPIVLFANL